MVLLLKRLIYISVVRNTMNQWSVADNMLDKVSITLTAGRMYDKRLKFNLVVST